MTEREEITRWLIHLNERYGDIGDDIDVAVHMTPRMMKELLGIVRSQKVSK